MWWHAVTHGSGTEGDTGEWQWVASTLHTTSEHGVSSITTADAHTSAASSRLNRRRFKWTRPFRAKDEICFLRVCHHISNAVYRSTCRCWLFKSCRFSFTVAYFVIRKTSVLHLNKMSPPLENQNVNVKVDLSLTWLNKSLFFFDDIFLSRDLVERRSVF